MSNIYVNETFTENSTFENETISNFRQPKTIQGPLLGLLLASTLLAKASQAKPYFLSYGQSPWIPSKSAYNHLHSGSPPWYPIFDHHYHPYFPTTSSPQIQPPPLNQQQIIHIHDSPSGNNPPDEDSSIRKEYNHQHISTNLHNIDDDSDEDAASTNINISKESSLDNFDYPVSTFASNDEIENQQLEEIDGDTKADYDNDADSSNITYQIVKLISVDRKFNGTEENCTNLNVSSEEFDGNNTLNDVETEIVSGIATTTVFPEYFKIEDNFTNELTKTKQGNLEKIEAENALSENLEDNNVNESKRSRRTTPRTTITRRGGGSRRPFNDYDNYRNRNKNKSSKRRTTTPNYDDYNFSNKQANRRKRRPPQKTKRPNRRPVNRDPDYYDSDYKNDDYYDEYYSNIFARQGTESDTTESSTTTTSSATTTGTPTTQTTGTTSPTTATPNHTQGYTYGPPVQTGYGPPGQTGYGPSNGNEHISITYPPMSGPGRDVLAPLLDAWYNQYSKSSVIRRLQELLQPGNYYNSAQYDNYPETF